MSSNGGHYDNPFGYDQNAIHGMGLPDYISPGPPPGPPGQPLLNQNEHQNLDSFFSDFESGASAQGHDMMQMQYNTEHGQFEMPPNFVRSETSMGQRSGIEHGNLYNSGGMYGHNVPPQSTHSYNSGNNFSMQPTGFNNDQFGSQLIDELHSAAATVMPQYEHTWQNSQYPANMFPMQAPTKQSMRFGSDSHFRPTGYSAPEGVAEPEMNISWVGTAQSSATNTAPNTQPPSPNWSKKRKLEEFQDRSPNGFVPNGSIQQYPQPSPPQSNPRRQRPPISTRPSLTHSQPHTPITSSKPETPLEALKNPDDEDDAEGEDDDAPTEEAPRPPSPAPWPSSKARPARSNKQPPPPKPRKPSRTSSSKKLSTASSRTPLTSDQKKANHTNSEQRRRDATARSYAELYDLVPELEEMGKQSTMKKLEVVVAKVASTKKRVELLRMKLGRNPQTGLAFGGTGGAGAVASGSSLGGIPGIWAPH